MFCRDGEGNLVQLGSGAYGQVGLLLGWLRGTPRWAGWGTAAQRSSALAL